MVRHVKGETVGGARARRKGWEWEQESAILLIGVVEERTFGGIQGLKPEACSRMVRHLHRKRG
jgi:hypothetical protein